MGVQLKAGSIDVILLPKEKTLLVDVARLFTPAEAGAVSGLNLKAVHNAIDKRIVDPVSPAKPSRPGPGQGRGPKRRLLTAEDLVHLRLWRGVGGSLSAERRQRLFREVAAHPEAVTVKADDLLIVDVGEARKQVDWGVRELEAAELIVHRDKAIMGGEPVFRGTRIPVYDIAAMLNGGADREALLQGYPSLDARMLDAAVIWATAHPRRGRPKRLGDYGLKPRSSKRLALKSDPLAGKARAASSQGE
jgi:uncharacterized protein (DUF433 family)